MAAHIVVTRFGMVRLSSHDAEQDAIRDRDQVTTSPAGGSVDRADRPSRRRPSLRRPWSPAGRHPPAPRCVLGRVRWIGAALGVVSILGLWIARLDGLVGRGLLGADVTATWDALVEMWREATLWPDLVAQFPAGRDRLSISLADRRRRSASLIGSFASARGVLRAADRLPALHPGHRARRRCCCSGSASTRRPKITLIVVGTVFYNILMVADVARAVPRELLNASYTLGAGRWTRPAAGDLPALVAGHRSTSPGSTWPPPG